MDINKIDKIILTSSELDYISEWISARHFDSIDLPLDEVFVILKNITKIDKSISIGTHFKLDKDTGEIYIGQYDVSDMYLMVSGTLGEEFFKTQRFENMKAEPRFIRTLGEDHLQKALLMSGQTVLNIFQYMNHCPENITATTKTKQTKKPSRKKSPTRSRYTKIKTTTYTFQSEPNPNPRQYTKHVHSWTVRGHWRYYKKTGKRVWINGYKKGKGEPEGKLYKI